MGSLEVTEPHYSPQNKLPFKDFSRERSLFIAIYHKFLLVFIRNAALVFAILIKDFYP